MKIVGQLFFWSCIITIITITAILVGWFYGMLPMGLLKDFKLIFLNLSYLELIATPIIFYYLRPYTLLLILAQTHSSLSFFYDLFLRKNCGKNCVYIHYVNPWHQVNQASGIFGVLMIIFGYVYFVLYFWRKFKHRHGD